MCLSLFFDWLVVLFIRIILPLSLNESIVLMMVYPETTGHLLDSFFLGVFYLMRMFCVFFFHKIFIELHYNFFFPINSFLRLNMIQMYIVDLFILCNKWEYSIMGVRESKHQLYIKYCRYQL